MFKELVSVLKQSAVAILVVIGLLAALRQSSASKPVGQLMAATATGAVRGTVSPFEQDFSNYSPAQAAEMWNDWGNEYSHSGPITNTFLCYLNAVRLMPHESTYHRNLATSLFMYRKDAKDFFNVTEDQVFDMSLREYRKARILSPDNFELAKELALVHYAVKPFRAEEALTEWNRLLKLADNRSAADREEVYLNLGRVNYMAARYAEAQKWLLKVTSPEREDMKNILWRRVTESAQLRHDEVSN